jgi:hypothetical protein
LDQTKSFATILAMMPTQDQPKWRLTHLAFCYRQCLKILLPSVKETIKNFTKPETAVLAAGVVSDTCPGNIIRPTRFLG